MRSDRALPINGGFTLIEVLVVLLIVSIITAVAVMALGDQFGGKTRREKIVIEQFSQTITIAQQQAILTPAVLGLGVTTDGYRYYTYEPQTVAKTQGHWETVPGVLSRAKAFQNLFSVHVAAVEGVHYDSDTAGLKSQSSIPAIVFLPSGYVTPFEVTLKGEKSYTVTVSSNGAVHVA